MTDQDLIDLRNKVSELEKSRPKHDGGLIIDQFCNLERIINRLDAILDGERDTDIGANCEAWRCILSDEATNALNDLVHLRDDIRANFAVDEYKQRIKEKYAANSETVDQTDDQPETADQPY